MRGKLDRRLGEGFGSRSEKNVRPKGGRDGGEVPDVCK